MDDAQHDSQTARGDAVVLRTIVWKDLCPWLLLFRCPGIALRMDILALATAGGVLTAFAWMIAGWIFFLGSPLDDLPETNTPTIEERQEINIALIHQDLSQMPGSMDSRLALVGDAAIFPDRLDDARNKLDVPFTRVWLGIFTGAEPFHAAWQRLARPYIELFSLRASLRQFGYLLCGCLLSLLVWSMFGGAIARCAAMQLAHEERIGPIAGLKFAVKKVFSYFASPLFPLLGTALFTLGVFLFVGLPMNADIGLVWSGLVWIVVLICGLFVGVLLLGLLFGWPLMWATISTEGTDTFDALSRTYAYTMQRPIQYLLYVLLVGLLGTLTWILVIGFSESVIHVSWWAADWGVFDEQRMEAIMANTNGDQPAVDYLASEGTEITSPGNLGTWMLGFANGCLRAVAYSFVYGYLFVGATGIYLVLRRDVDHTETDEIYLDDDSESYGLPPLKDDESGVPHVDTPDGNEKEDAGPASPGSTVEGDD